MAAKRHAIGLSIDQITFLAQRVSAWSPGDDDPDVGRSYYCSGNNEANGTLSPHSTTSHSVVLTRSESKQLRQTFDTT